MGGRYCFDGTGGPPDARDTGYHRRASVSRPALVQSAPGTYLQRRTFVHTLRVVRFEWDSPKAAANLRTHGVSFAEAVTVLEDDFALTREDGTYGEEQRFVTLGFSDSGTLLVVVYVYREPDIIRMISAWKANRRQKEHYEENRC